MLTAGAKPIGVFDSGVGGLTVAKAIKTILPNETICYIGDTINLPYGNKTTQVLQSYVQRIGDFFIKKNVKAIVIACNTATAAAAELLQAQVGDVIPVLNVIDPIINQIVDQYAHTTLGLIGTSYTIDSAIYEKKIAFHSSSICLKSLPAPLLAPMIEADIYQQSIVDNYLSHPNLSQIDGLILGCTHYWFIKKQIANFYHQRIPIINGAHLVAGALEKKLMSNHALNQGIASEKDEFFVTQHATIFETILKRLFEHASLQLLAGEHLC